MSESPPTSIALQLTPPGAAAIAVIRLTGPAIAPFLRRHFDKQPRPGRCVHGLLRDDDDHVLDDPLVVLSPDERHADVNLHGGPWVVRSVLELARRNGFEAREPTGLPLPAEAVDAESELQCEVLTHLPMAKTEPALRELLAQEAAWEELLSLPEPQRRVEAAAMLADASLHHLLHPPRVAIAGAPNVGKSTLANQLFAQKRSITADVPGTTRDWVGEVANIDGLPVLLVDTPGIRCTTDPIEAAAIERSAGELQHADLVLLVLDRSRPIEPEQRELLERFPRAMRVINKCDRPAAWDHARHGGLEIIATTGSGLDALRASVHRHFGIGTRPGAAKWWTDRQQRMLQTPPL